MSKLPQTITDLESDFKANALIISLEQENASLKQQVAHLESMLKHSKHLSIKVSPEEQICTEQIFLLKEKSSDRELSLEEVKRLDILVKNLKLIRGDDITINSTAISLPSEEAELVALAKGHNN